MRGGRVGGRQYSTTSTWCRLEHHRCANYDVLRVLLILGSFFFELYRYSSTLLVDLEFESVLAKDCINNITYMVSLITLVILQLH